MEAIDECIVAYNPAASAAEHGACQIIAASIVEYVTHTTLWKTTLSAPPIWELADPVPVTYPNITLWGTTLWKSTLSESPI